MQFVKIYDQQQNLLCELDTADSVKYTLKRNDLHVASLRLPAKDPRNAYCRAHNYVEIKDGKRKPILFRILMMPSSTKRGWSEYQLEHALATLIDDVLEGYHQIGGTGVPRRAVLEYILSFQDVRRWQLGVCEFVDYFEYKFEDDNLLKALFSTGNVLVDAYNWEADTSTMPWTLHLRKAEAVATCGIHYMRNLVQITKSMDATKLITRLFLRGYGEGVNQLNVSSVNGGKKYIEADTVSVWGRKTSVYADKRIESASLLLARGRAILKGLKNPLMSYTAKAVDLYNLTGYEWDNYMPGKVVHVEDSEDGVVFDGFIEEMSKPNYQSKPWEIEITIANKPLDSADSINALAERLGISELYSQGNTVQYVMTFADNADESHPARLDDYVFQETVRINKRILAWRLEAFRAFSTGAASGGGSTSTTATGGSGTITTQSSSSSVSLIATGPIDLDGNDANYTEPASGSGSHQHYFYHRHPLSGIVVIPPLSGNVPSHSHSVTIPSHTHPMLYGIYEGPTASTVTIRVDGTAIPTTAITGKTEIDVVPYMAKDSDGRITRGSWHTIEIVPNGQTRIVANLACQTFNRSRGGGDY